jgi:hypothetical protein
MQTMQHKLLKMVNEERSWSYLLSPHTLAYYAQININITLKKQKQVWTIWLANFHEG